MPCELPLDELRKLARRGDVTALTWLGLYYEEGLQGADGRWIVRRNPRLAAKYHLDAAERGDDGAQLAIGNYLYDGFGVEKDIKRALYWYRRAFRRGLVCAAANIALVYRDSGNRRLAYRWFLRCANLGDGDAWVDVGEMRRY
jgi:TPR repeat protein